MIWSERRNLCYIHIPKTGGSAVTFAYAEVMLFGDVILGGPHFAEVAQAWYQEKLNVHKHSSASRIAAIVGEERFRQSFSFAVIRDPVQRLVSYYKWLRSPQSQHGLSEVQQRLKECAEFEDFVQKACEDFHPQADFVRDARGNVMVSQLVAYENLAGEWQKISERAGFSIDLPVANKSASVAVEVTDAAVQMVRERYRCDYQLLGQD